MSNFKFKKAISFILAFALVLGMTSLAAFAAPSPLFEMPDVETRQGEEFEIVIKFARNVTSILDPVAALDVTLSFDSNVYSVVSMENGDGLNAALERITSGDSNLENDYIFSTSAKIPGEVKWSLVTLQSFTFYGGEDFMKIRFKANDLSDLTKNLNMTIKVTSAAAPETLADVTSKFSSFTNKMEVEANLTTMCDWEYVEALGGYRLVKFNGENVENFTIPDEYDDPDDDFGALPVVSIGSGAFRENKGIKKVSLSENIVNVGSAAFFRCENLEKIVVFSEETRFGANCMYGDEKLVVKCLEGSEADAYAQKNAIDVEYFESVADGSCKGTDEKVYYTGTPVELSNLKVYNSKNQLMKLGADYIVYYMDNIEIGKAKIMITGRGEYLGTKVVEFDILCPYHSVENPCYTEQVVYSDCELGGYVMKDCTFCGLHDDSTVAPAKEHGEVAEVADPDATCTDAGVKKFVCKDCAKVLSTEEIPVKEHTTPENGEWKVEKEATCKEAGKAVLYCADCDYVVDTKEIPMLEDHVYDWVVTTQPTCTTDGVETYQCRFCGYFEGEAVTRVATACHKMGDWVVVTPVTCEQDGLKTRNCTVCGQKPEEDVIPHAGHTEGDWTTLAERTCTTDGHYVKYCTAEGCGAILAENKESKYGHTDGEWEIVSELTCTQDGVKKLHCAVCDAVCKTETTPHEGHKSGDWVTVEPTCAKAGAKNHYCSVCEEVYESEPIAVLPHTPGDWETVAEPTCTLTGMKHKVCQACGEATETEEIEELGHSNVITTVELPTYRKEGKDRLGCATCGVFVRYIPTKKLSADIDGGGSITASDALLILQHATGLKELEGDQLKNANLDGYGGVNSSDALIVLQIATGLITV